MNELDFILAALKKQEMDLGPFQRKYPTVPVQHLYDRLTGDTRN